MTQFFLRNKIILPSVIIYFAVCHVVCAAYVPTSKLTPPTLAHEFRGVWIATVNNIDWPSKPGLPVDQQKSELIKILDLAVKLKLNVVIFQVRPSCDAFYISHYEPWSEYLTGEMGKPPTPLYDPLEFAVEEAHKRGLELHAWVNPFRARHTTSKSPISNNHISRTTPSIVKQYGKQLWLDPGSKQAQEYSTKVILDIVRRYDIDGLHIDDYFYPYPEKDAAGREIPFPDSDSYSKYKSAGGKLSIEDWRRENINQFIHSLYSQIHSVKSHVKFGISPFGIWRPGFPEQIRGMDAYERIYADSKKWLNNGWLDYFSPQLYWQISEKAQSFPVLLRWWASQNSKKRIIAPGLNTSRVGKGWESNEIIEQIRIVRKTPDVSGHIHWNASSLMQNKDMIVDRLLEIYREPALIPKYSWLEHSSPSPPKVYVSSTAKNQNLIIHIEPRSREKPFIWLIQVKIKTTWNSKIISGEILDFSIHVETLPEMIAVSAVDRCGNISSPSVLYYK